MAGTYQPDARGMRQLAQSSQMGAAMVQAAQAGKQWAEMVAPRDSGEYAGAFRVERRDDVRGGRNNEKRAGAALVNDAPHAGAVEHKHHVLARAVNIIEGQR